MLNKKELNLLRKAYNQPDYKFLAAENKRLKEMVKKLENKNQQLIKQVQSTEVRARTAEHKALKYQKAAQLKEVRIQKLKTSIAAKKPKQQAPKSYKADVDFTNKAAKREWNMKTLYLPQFFRRLKEHYGSDFKLEWIEEIRPILEGMKPYEITLLFDRLGLTKMLYESDQIYTDEAIDLTAEDAYEFIKSYRD